MSDEVTELAERGRALAPEDSERLVDLLLESLPGSSVQEVEAAWEVEIDRRDAEIESGKSRSYPAMRSCPAFAPSLNDRPDWSDDA